MRSLRSGRILGLILVSAMFITSVPADVLAAEGLTVSEDAAFENVNTEETGILQATEDDAEPGAAASDKASQTTEDAVSGETKEDVQLADEIVIEGAIPDEAAADGVTLDDAVEENTSANVTAEDDAVSGDFVSEDIIPDGTAPGEDAETLSEDEVTQDKDGTPEERLKGYLREGASNIEEVEGTLKEGKNAGFGTYVKSKIYTYKADGETWRALYLWSDASNDAKLDGVYIYSVYYYEVKNITDIILDDSITGIETYGIFSEMEKVSHVRLSANLKTLAQNCFANCSSIENITIPKTMEASGYDPFTRCSGLKTITFEDGIKVIPDYIAEEKYSGGTECRLEKVYIPSSVKEIGKFAFHGQSHLREVIFTDISNTTLSRIGMEAFSATNLEYLDLPKFGGKWKDEYGKEHWPIIQNLAFDGIHNPKFTKVIIPEGVVTITEIWGSGGSVYTDLYLPSTLERKNDSTDDGFLESTAEQFFPASIERIHYPGSKSQFEKKALGSHLPGDMKIIRNCNWYKKMVWNSKARPVSGISVPSDKTTILKYYDDISGGEKETIDLATSPAGHLDAEYTVEVKGDNIVAAKLGAENKDTGKLPLTLTYRKAKGEATVTVSGGQASTAIKVIIKDKEQVVKPVIMVNGKAVSESTVNVKKGDWIIARSQTDDCTILYKAGSLSWVQHPGGYVIGRDLLKEAPNDATVTISAYARKDGFKDSVATSSLTLKNRLDMGDVTGSDMYGRTFIPDGLWIPENSYDETPFYTGSAITIPDLKVFCYNKLLKYGRDYMVKYTDNILASSVSGRNAAFVVSGKGNYSGVGTITGSFYIQKEDLSSLADYSYTPATVAYTGAQLKPDIGFIYKGKKLKRDVDYSIKYRQNGGYSTTDSVTNAGKYDAIISGKGNYEGGFNINACVCIVNKSINVSMADVRISKVKDQQLVKRGEAVKPDFSVEYNKQILPESAYTVAYRNNNTAGTATVTLTGTGINVNVGGKSMSFMGIKTFTFKIKPINISRSDIKVNPQIYTGEAIYPSVTVKMDGVLLTTGVDYTLSYKNNVNAGTATVIVNGRGSFDGKKSIKFAINKASIADVDVKLEKYSYSYTSGGVKPPVTVILGGVTLPPKDYKITYSGNKAPGTGTVTVTGKGNITGSGSKTYTITNGKLQDCTANFKDKIFSNKASIYSQKITITDTNGGKLKAGRDYDKTFVYKYAGDTRVNQKAGKKAYISVLRKAGALVDDNDIIPAGATITVTVTGTGNYAGSSLTGSFRFGAGNISSLKFDITPQPFTGSRVLPGRKAFKNKNKMSDVEFANSFEIVSYGTNINKGTGTVTVRGRGDYAGTRIIKFKIK